MSSQGEGDSPKYTAVVGDRSIGVRKRSSSINARVCWQRRFEEDHRMWGGSECFSNQNAAG
jgi:hypothetical protein